MEVTTGERYASGGPGRELMAQNLVKAFDATVERLDDDVAIRTADDAVTVTWDELRRRVRAIAGGLAGLGVSKGDTVALMLNNRPEFIPVDLAAVSLGAVPFSIYQTAAPEQIEYVISDAGARVIVVESSFLALIEEIKQNLPELDHVVVVDADGGTATLTGLESADPDFDPTPIADAIEPDDLLTLIYTSGTTGPPKGVQLTHRNLMTLVSGVEDVIEMPERGGKVISWLPAAHIAERGAHYYLPVTRGVQVTICSDPRKIVEFLPQVRPTWVFSVPRIFEKLKSGLEAKLASLPGEQAEAARKAIAAATRKVQLESAGQEVPEDLRDGVAQAEEQMFSKIRAQLGLDEAGGGHVRAGHRGPARPGCRDQARRRRRGDGQGGLGDAGLPQHGREERGDVHRGRVAHDRRYRRTRRGWVPEHRRPQEGADHQRRGQEHVTGEHRVEAEADPAGGSGGRDRRLAQVRLRPAHARPRRHRRVGEATRGRGLRPRLAGRQPGAGRRGGAWGGGGERRPRTRGADQALRDPSRAMGAGRRRAHADDEVEAQADRRKVRRPDRRPVRGLTPGGRAVGRTDRLLREPLRSLGEANPHSQRSAEPSPWS